MAGRVYAVSCYLRTPHGDLSPGQTVRQGHPHLDEGRQDAYFAEVECDAADFEYEPPKRARVEQATAAPGERRDLPDRKGPGRPKLPRDDAGNIIREE